MSFRWTNLFLKAISSVRLLTLSIFPSLCSLARPYYSHTGQPSVDPVVLFKTLLIGCLYGITSGRRLMAEVEVNLAFRWFLGYDLDRVDLTR